MVENGKLSRNQKRAIAAMLTTTTTRDAARVAGLGETTVYRYLRDPLFRAELQARQDEILAGTTAALVGLTGKAVESLHDSMAVLRDHLGISLGDFVQIDDGGGWSLDLRKAEQAGIIRYVKELDYDKDRNPRIKLHDAQAAARMLGSLALGILDERRRQAELEELTERIEQLEQAAGIT